MSALTPDFELTRCVRYRYRYSECRRCQEACPHEAIVPGDEGVVLDAGRCRNCALCTTACPTAALVPGNLPRVELLKRAITGKTASFACLPSGLAADATVPCLGALDGAMLAYLGKRGIAVELRGASHCESCEHGSRGAEALARNGEICTALDEACGETWASLTVVSDTPAASFEEFRSGRRGLFRRLIGRGVAEAEKAIQEPLELPVVDKAIRPGPWYVPEMRELLAIVCRRQDGEPCLVPAVPGLPLAQMTLARGCTHCEACVRACPTGALQIRETANESAFLFFPDRCVGCAVCAEVCQPRVLRPARIANATAKVGATALDILAKQRCQRCDRFFASSAPAAICPVCRDDDDAFGSIFG